MIMDKSDGPKPAPKPQPEPDTREARLAAALRTNLRRRKAADRGDKGEE